MLRDMGVLVTLACLFLPLVASNYTVAQPAQTIPPVTYCMFCDGREYPNNGPLGYYEFTTWDRVNPAPGVYDWSDPDAKIAKCPNDAPLLLIVELYLSQPPRSFVPAWIPNGNLWLSYGACASVPIPNYTNGAVRDAYWAMVEAFGVRYGDDHRVSIVIGPGLDGEAVLAKAEGDCDWLDAAKQIPGLEYQWGQWVKQSIVKYREAFPNTPVFFPIAAGGQARCVWADICAVQDPPVGLKHNGMTYDLPDWQVTGAPPCCGAFTAFEQHPELPRIVESKSGAGNTQSLAWSLYAGMSELPDAGVVHPDYLTRLPSGMLEQFATTYGKDMVSSPLASIVFRDQEFPTDPWCGASGHVGDWEMWLSRVEGGEPALQGAARPAGASDGWQGRQLRKGPMQLMLNFPPGDCVALIDWYDASADPWAVTWWDGDKRRSQTIQGTGGNVWRVATVEAMQIDPGEYIGIEGEPFVHRVQVWSWGHLLGTPTPTATPSPTWTQAATPMPTETTTPTSEPLPTPTWTIDEQVHDFRIALQGRLFRELGGFWLVDVSLWPATSTYPTLTP